MVEVLSSEPHLYTPIIISLDWSSQLDVYGRVFNIQGLGLGILLNLSVELIEKGGPRSPFNVYLYKMSYTIYFFENPDCNASQSGDGHEQFMV